MKDLNVNVKRDCFAYKRGCIGNGSSYCVALNKLYCETEECKFYQTKEELIEKERKILERRKLENEVC